MNKTKYRVRRIACNINDYYSDRHRFRFEYDGYKFIVSCYQASIIIFNYSSELNFCNNVYIPKEVQEEVRKIILEKIDKNEFSWRYPKKLYKTADDATN